MSSLSGARCFRAAAVSLALVLLSGGWPATAQFAPSQSGSSARPIVLSQSSGASVAGSASVQQTTSPQGANTTTSSVQLSGNVQGSVPGADVTPGPVALTLADGANFRLRFQVLTIYSSREG